MKFLKYFTAALLPALALATPSPVQRGPLPRGAGELPHQVEERAPLSTDITSLLGNILPDISALTALLQPAVITDIKTVVVGLATVFSGDTPTQTKNLISQASGLLTADLIKQISAILPSVESLLTTDFINGIKTLLTNVEALLTKTFVDQVSGLINDVAPLVSAVAQVITTLISAVLGS